MVIWVHPAPIAMRLASSFASRLGQRRASLWKGCLATVSRTQKQGADVSGAVSVQAHDGAKQSAAQVRCYGSNSRESRQLFDWREGALADVPDQPAVVGEERRRRKEIEFTLRLFNAINRK